MKTQENAALSLATGLAPGFHLTRVRAGLIFDASMTMYPSLLQGHVGDTTRLASPITTYFGIVLEGNVVIKRDGLPDMGLGPMMYFSGPGSLSIEGDGKAAIFSRQGYRGLFTVGGPVEETGRLCYIDNCSVSQLVPPARMTDPTLQLLVFPPNVDQTHHIHPTLRFGLVLRGRGECHLGDGSKHQLLPGCVFHIEERAVHGFHTSNEGMTVIAYHPDSDVGPTDHEHPMLSRTYLRNGG